MIDRFGPLPSQIIDLLDSVRLKWEAKRLGLERVVLKDKRLYGYFIADQKSPFFESDRFTDVLKFLQNNSKICVMKEKETKQGLRLLITFIHITSLQKALNTLRSI